LDREFSCPGDQIEFFGNHKASSVKVTSWEFSKLVVVHRQLVRHHEYLARMNPLALVAM